MNFLHIQIIIFSTIIISSIIAGKKGTLISFLIWVIETYIVFKIDSISYIQLITLGLAFQVAIIIAIIRDLITKKIKRRINN